MNEHNIRIYRALARKLLAHAYWRWDDCETGAPCIDPKRPYGNSDVENDVREILELPDLSNEEALDIHRETLDVLREMTKPAEDKHD